MYTNSIQKAAAKQYIEKIQPMFSEPIVTEVVMAAKFYEAEENH